MQAALEGGLFSREATYTSNLCPGVNPCIIVKDGGEIFFVKPHHGANPAGTSNSAGVLPDVKEFFGYHLLSAAGVGPSSVRFVPTATGSRRTVYIVSSGVAGFTEAPDLRQRGGWEEKHALCRGRRHKIEWAWEIKQIEAKIEPIFHASLFNHAI